MSPGYSFLVIPLLVFLVLLTNKLDGSIRISYFAASAPLFLTFFTPVSYTHLTLPTIYSV